MSWYPKSWMLYFIYFMENPSIKGMITGWENSHDFLVEVYDPNVNGMIILWSFLTLRY
jgi:hypothetical protein